MRVISRPLSVVGRWWIIAVVLALGINGLQVEAQNAPCGVVDGIDLPVADLVMGYDDFGLFRRRFDGNHTGIDLAFDRWGDPIRAAARGQVTLANPLEWDTEKGVVVVAHTLPDGSRIYSVYGHVEETDTIFLPAVGGCVERGQIIAAVGWPSRGRPHLHYEIRTRLPNEGGPGYVTTNPLNEGWFNPLDFTAVWQARLNPAFLNAISFDLAPSLPPLQNDIGTYIVASGDTISAVLPPGQVLWRVQTDGAIKGFTSLPGDRVIAHTITGQTVALQGGRYTAIWTVQSAETPFITLGERLIFLMPDNTLAAYDPLGKALWSLPGATDTQITYFGSNGTQIGMAVQIGTGVTWREVNADGQVTAELPLSAPPLAAPQADGSWLMLDGTRLKRLHDGQNQEVTSLNGVPGRAAQLASDATGNIYVYLDDAAHTLLALAADGSLRWQIEYPRAANFDAPLLAAGNGCWLYTLDMDGRLNVFSGADGRLLNQMALYAGGRRTTQTNARLLTVNTAEQVQVASGYLTMMTLDGSKLGGTC